MSAMDKIKVCSSLFNLSSPILAEVEKWKGNGVVRKHRTGTTCHFCWTELSLRTAHRQNLPNALISKDRIWQEVGVLQQM